MQRDVALPVWGWTQPRATVSVSIGKAAATAVAGADGRWLVQLPPTPAGGPYVLTVSSPGETAVKAGNILFGDVWLCSGQSNMSMGLAEVTHGRDEVAAANYPEIRLLTAPLSPSAKPLQTTPVRWTECKPEAIAQHGEWGGFSAVAYFFGRDLYRELKVPIGLVVSAAGGTNIEAWSSASALKGVDRLKAELEQLKRDANTLTRPQWLEKFDPGSPGEEWAKAAFNDSAWLTMKLPTYWEKAGGAGFDGVVWFRRVVDVPAAWSGKDLVLELARIDDADTTWFNGQIVGSGEDWNEPRRYKIPGKLVKVGKNVIAVRVMDDSDNGGIWGEPELMRLSLTGEKSEKGAIPLAGPWRYRTGAQISAKTGVPKKAGPVVDQNRPTSLYDGMIAPLEPFAFKGLLWYQGESNADNSLEYGDLLTRMIEDLRRQFYSPKLPVILVQLPSIWRPQQNAVEDGGWTGVREGQLDVYRKLPAIGLVTTLDLGEENNIHPGNKQDVGYRASLAALGTVYGRKVAYSGPIYRGMKIEGAKVIIDFDFAESGLAIVGEGPLKSFAIRGEKGDFVKAEAEIKGGKVVVWSDAVPKPTAVRYAWAANPTGNLTNKTGFPASPFRTDRP